MREPDRPDEIPVRKKSNKVGPKPASSSKTLLIVLAIGAVGMSLFCCIGGGGGLAYYLIGRGSGAESQMVGEWEMDPEYLKEIAKGGPAAMMGANIYSECQLTFRADHTYKLSFFIEQEGSWSVVSRDNKTLRVSLRARIFGLQADPVVVTVTMLDADHLEFDSGTQPGMSGIQGRFRRMVLGSGTVAPKKVAPNNPPSAKSGSGSVDPKQEQPDCEVEWGGKWYPAHVLKTEKDKWFIHYIGYPDNWNEWVTQERIRFPKK